MKGTVQGLGVAFRIEKIEKIALFNKAYRVLGYFG